LAAGALSEEACIVEGQWVTHDLLQCEVSKDGHQSRRQIIVTNLLAAEFVARTTIDDVDEMEFDHAVDIESKLFVLLHSC